MFINNENLIKAARVVPFAFALDEQQNFFGDSGYEFLFPLPIVHDVIFYQIWPIIRKISKITGKIRSTQVVSCSSNSILGCQSGRTRLGKAIWTRQVLNKKNVFLDFILNKGGGVWEACLRIVDVRITSARSTLYTLSISISSLAFPKDRTSSFVFIFPSLKHPKHVSAVSPDHMISE